MKSSFCIDLLRFMLIPTKFPLSRNDCNQLRGDSAYTYTKTKEENHC